MNNELYHHGVLGMKWGVRRYQNKDGSLTEEGSKRAQEKEFALAKKSQKVRYRSSYDRMNDYLKKSKTVQERSKELNELSQKAKDLDQKLDAFQSEKATKLAWKRASEKAEKEIPEYSSMSERSKLKMAEYYVYDGGELNKAVKETNRNNPKYQALEKKYNQTISAYKDKCKQIANEIIGDYGNTKITGLGTDMNYRELVYYALSKPNMMWMFTHEEDMGRK